MEESMTEVSVNPEDFVKCEEKQEIDLDRVHIKNIPSCIGFKQFKKFLEKILGDVKSKKIRHMSDYAYVTFDSPENAQKGIALIDGYDYKKHTLSAQLAAKEVKHYRAANTANTDPANHKTARESVSPLVDMEYEKQLEHKQNNSVKVIDKMYTQLNQNKVSGLGKQTEFRKRLLVILPSPKTKEYRNKCEFTIGHDLNGKICVGFVGGRFSKNQHFVIPPVNVDIVSTQMMAIVSDVHDFVKESELEPFNEFERKGFWRMLTIREFGGDVMLIFTVFPLNTEEKIEEIKDKIKQRFLNFDTFEKKKYRVCSVYWQQMVHISDLPNYSLIGGTPYIYESLLGCRFRVSPPAFFQTNSQGASVLYSTIGEFCGLIEKEDNNAPIENNASETQSSDVRREASPENSPKNKDELEQPHSKKAKYVQELICCSEETSTTSSIIPDDTVTILLDICCGTGTISQCLLKNIPSSKKVFSIGIEMIAEAVEDAKQNAKQNKMEKFCKYISGKAEDTFRSLRYHLPTGFDLKKSKVIGILDPPRAGMHEKVILACREMETMRRLIFVSCEPTAAINNIVNLCRPTSRKYTGDAFSVTRIQPVDMFPQTNHMEWIIQLDR